LSESGDDSIFPVHEDQGLVTGAILLENGSCAIIPRCGEWWDGESTFKIPNCIARSIKLHWRRELSIPYCIARNRKKVFLFLDRGSQSYLSWFMVSLMRTASHEQILNRHRFQTNFLNLTLFLKQTFFKWNFF